MLLFGHTQAEAQLFKDTVHGCVKMLVEILELTSPAAIGRGTRIREWVKQASLKLKVEPLWLMDMAALLSHIGCVGLPKPILHKLETGEDLNKEELAVFRTHPEIAVQLLGNIPRMGKVAELIRYQNESCRRDPPKGSRILRVCLDLDYLGRKGVPPDKALGIMRGSPGTHDPEVVATLTQVLDEAEQAGSLKVTVAELKPGMVMLADMVTKAGTKLLLKGQPPQRRLPYAAASLCRPPRCGGTHPGHSARRRLNTLSAFDANQRPQPDNRPGQVQGLRHVHYGLHILVRAGSLLGHAAQIRRPNENAALLQGGQHLVPRQRFLAWLRLKDRPAPWLAEPKLFSMAPARPARM